MKFSSLVLSVIWLNCQTVLLFGSGGCSSAVLLRPISPTHTSFVTPRDERLTLQGVVAPEVFAAALGVRCATQKSIDSGPLPRLLSVSEILSRNKVRVEYGSLIDDYVVVGMAIERASLGLSHKTIEAGASVHLATVTCSDSGTEFQIGGTKRYLISSSTQTEATTVTAQDERQIKTGFYGRLNFDRIDTTCVRVIGHVQLTVLQSDLDTADMSLPFDIVLRGSSPRAVHRFAIADARMSAQLRELTGQLFAAGEVVDLVLSLE